jgi:hypothetical protein
MSSARIQAYYCDTSVSFLRLAYPIAPCKLKLLRVPFRVEADDLAISDEVPEVIELR